MFRFRCLTPLAGALLLAGFAQAHAQSANRSVVQVPPRPAPTIITPATPGPALPNPAGLPSTSPFPAGIPSLPRAATPATPATPATATAPAPSGPATPALDGTVLMPSSAIGGTRNGNASAAASGNPTAAMGAGGGANAARVVPSGAGPYTALQLAESFQRADANRDGELSRAEVQRLTIAPATFEEMDRDRDGVLTRSEYEDGTR